MTYSTAPQALYRFYGDDGALLYVGITASPPARFSQHGKSKSWWPEVRGISIEWYDGRDAVAAAEKRAIKVENPKYNVSRPTLPAQPIRIGARFCGHCPACVRPEDFDYPDLCYVHNPPPDEDEIVCDMCGSATCVYGVAYRDGIDAGMRWEWVRNERAIMHYRSCGKEDA